MFIGDLNTMGMKYSYDKSIKPDTELRKLDHEAKKVKMQRLTKIPRPGGTDRVLPSRPATWTMLSHRIN